MWTRPLVHKNSQKPSFLGSWRHGLKICPARYSFPMFSPNCVHRGFYAGRVRSGFAFWSLFDCAGSHKSSRQMSCAFRLRRLAQSVGTTWLMPEGLLYRRAMIVFELCKVLVAGVASGVLRDTRRTSDTFSSAWHFCTLLKRWRVEVRGGFLGRVAQYFVDLSKKVFKTQIKQCFHKMFSFLVRAAFGEIVASACATLVCLGRRSL